MIMHRVLQEFWGACKTDLRFESSSQTWITSSRRQLHRSMVTTRDDEESGLIRESETEVI